MKPVLLPPIFQPNVDKGTLVTVVDSEQHTAHYLVTDTVNDGEGTVLKVMRDPFNEPQILDSGTTHNPC